MKQDYLHKYFDSVIEITKEKFAKDGECPPMAFFINKKEEMNIMPMMFRNDFEKQMMANILKAIAKEKDIVAFIFTMESWLIKRDANVPINTHERPSQSKDRQECIIMNLETELGTQGRIFFIMRDKQPAYLIEQTNMRNGMTGGLFANILKKSFNRN